MSSSRDNAKDNLALRNYGVDYDRAEEAVVLTKINDKVGTLLVTTLHIDRCYGRLGYTNVEAVVGKTLLECTGNLPKLLLILGVLADKVETLERTDNHRHRQRLSVEL